MGTNYLQNPGTLKIDLMLQGLRYSECFVAGFSGSSGLDIVLPGGIRANVPCGEEFTSNSPYELIKKDEGFAITDGDDSIEVTLAGNPGFYSRHTKSGVLFSDIATVHGSYVVITPQSGCEFFEEGIECTYCAGNFDKDGPGRVFSIDDVLEVVEAVKKEKIAGIIYLSIGFSKGADGGIKFLTPYIKAIKKFFNVLVAVEALPPKQNRWIDHTYAVGADSILYNIEIFDKELFEVICPGRSKLVGRKRYLNALKYAATVFPSGTVASHLIVGLEPPGSTRNGIDFLTDMGVVPILPIYRPTAGRALRIEPLTAEIILPVYRHLYKTVKDRKINMNWVRDISVITTPIEGRTLFGDGDKEGKNLLEGFYKSRLGRKTAWGLSTLRRKLRVKGAAVSPRMKQAVQGRTPAKVTIRMGAVDGCRDRQKAALAFAHNKGRPSHILYDGSRNILLPGGIAAPGRAHRSG